MAKKIVTIALFLFLCLGLPAQQVKSSFRATDKLTINTYKSMGYVYCDLIKYYPEGEEASAASYWEPNNVVDTVRILDSFTFQKQKYTVTSIKESGFEDILRIRHIILPETIKRIAPRAFYSCSYLESIYIPSGCETIGSYSFCRTEVDTLILPEGVKIIGAKAFFECTHLKYVELPSTVEKLGERAFSCCNELKTVRVHFKEPLPIDEKHFFFTTPHHKIKLIVPKGTLEAYADADGWRYFEPIVEEDDE